MKVCSIEITGRMTASQKVFCHKEAHILIRKALRDISMPMDILVIRYQELRELADVPGLI